MEKLFSKKFYYCKPNLGLKMNCKLRVGFIYQHINFFSTSQIVKQMNKFCLNPEIQLIITGKQQIIRPQQNFLTLPNYSLNLLL